MSQIGDSFEIYFFLRSKNIAESRLFSRIFYLKFSHVSLQIKSNNKPTVTVGKSQPVQITYKPSPTTNQREPVEKFQRSPSKDDSDSEDHKRRRRNRDERPKTLPVTFTIRQPEPKARIVIRTSEESSSHTESSEDDTLTSGGESSATERKRTSIRIVSSAKSSAPSSDNEGKLSSQTYALRPLFPCFLWFAVITWSTGAHNNIIPKESFPYSLIKLLEFNF